MAVASSQHISATAIIGAFTMPAALAMERPHSTGKSVTPVGA